MLYGISEGGVTKYGFIDQLNKFDPVKFNWFFV